MLIVLTEKTGVRKKLPLSVRLYKGSYFALSRAMQGAEACLTAFWLAALSPDKLELIDEQYYTEHTVYVSHEYNRQGLAKWEQEVVEQYFPDRSRVLLIAAGGGRETGHLLKMGFDVDAYECHPGLAAFANEFLVSEGLKPAVTVFPRNECPTGDKTYDAMVVGWGAYMLVPTRKKRVELLKQIHSRLKDGAPILLSFFSRSGDSRRFRMVTRMANSLRQVLAREPLDIGDDLSYNFVHYFTEQEVRSEMEQAGFELVFYSSKPYGHAVGIAGGQTNT